MLEAWEDLDDKTDNKEEAEMDAEDAFVLSSNKLLFKSDLSQIIISYIIEMHESNKIIEVNM